MVEQLERWQIIDDNFVNRVKDNDLPKVEVKHQNSKEYSDQTDQGCQIGIADFLSLFDSIMTTRHIDLQARLLKQKNLGFYTIGSAGHEHNIALAYASTINDVAVLHYRSSAFMLERANKLSADKKDQQIVDQIRSLIASRYDPISQGRHKVFGSVELKVPPQTSTIASHLPKALGLALSINHSRLLSKLDGKNANHLNKDSIVICSFGDASSNHSTAQGTFNAARKISYEQVPLPLVFVCEDNNIGISVKTPKNWIEDNFKNSNLINYIQANGLNLLDVIDKAKQAIHIARVNKKPVFLHIKTVRLMGHAGSDIEQQYLTIKEIEDSERHDPLLYTASLAINLGYLDHQQILDLYNKTRKKVESYTNKIINEPKLNTKKEILSSIVPSIPKKRAPRVISAKLKEQIFSKVMLTWQQPRNMAQAINLSLAETLAQFPNTVIFGEDVGKKGGVYNVTSNLQRYFGRKRVFDTILDEQTILGTAIGFAQNGILPIVEIQFLAYLHNAIDQLRGEAATLSFFSGGKFANPMVIRLPSFAYQKGFGGHFHNENSFASVRDIPGLIIACPSSASKAIRLWQTIIRLAYIEHRICLFMEPIALYFIKSIFKEDDNLMLANFEQQDKKIDLGDIDVYDFETKIKSRNKLIIISYANGYNLSLKAADIINSQNSKLDLNISVIDLLWLKPLSLEKIISYITEIKDGFDSTNILIVDECRITCSISEELTTRLYEFLQSSDLNNKINMYRLAAEDCFIPLGPAANHVLPSVNSIVDKIIEIARTKVQDFTERAT